MKKTNISLLIGIGLLAFLPFIRVSVAAPPCWVGINDGDTYEWYYNVDTTAMFGAWTTDGVNLLLADNWNGTYVLWLDYMAWEDYNPGTMVHEITDVADLADDIEFGTNYSSVAYTHELTYYGETGVVIYPWENKDTQVNVFNGFIIDDETEFVDFHDGLVNWFVPMDNWKLYSIFVPNNFNWAKVVTAANAEITDATVTVVNNGTKDIGFKISVAALTWTTNTEAIGLEVTFDGCGLLDVWNLTYGAETIFTIEQTVGSTCTPCPSGGGIPGYELPIIIGITAVSIISLILIKKIKKK